VDPAEIVAVPSTHGADPVWAKLYRPATGSRKKYPIVMFVHGAGYLQNTTKRYPVYFREQMFHNLLVQKLHRAGHGLPRLAGLWPQLAHRHLPPDGPSGTGRLRRWPELWSPASGRRRQVGIYGGSYGGFMTFMALLHRTSSRLAPRCVLTDWTTYNHEYTANILNTPELDPQAYKVSSPIVRRQAEGHPDRPRHDRR
jgi:dipeptidyl aminopeptidase/acylaminoacyl peptidase